MGWRKIRLIESLLQYKRQRAAPRLTEWLDIGDYCRHSPELIPTAGGTLCASAECRCKVDRRKKPLGGVRRPLRQYVVVLGE